MTPKTYNVLFICTGNAARSIMAESVMNALGGGRFRAFSAGSFPKGAVHPHARQTLQELQLPADGLRGKSWDEFSAPGAPPLDFVFTLCDKAAGEACPVWPGQPLTAHWGMADPVETTGSEMPIERRFRDAALTIKRRVELMLALPVAALDRQTLQAELQQIGHQ